MVEQFKALKLQTSLIAIMAPALLIGVLLAGGGLVTLTAMDALAFDMGTAARDAAAALDASNLVTEMQLAGINYVVTGVPLHLAAHDRFRAMVGLYADSALAAEDHRAGYAEEYGVADQLNGIQQSATDYDAAWEAVLNAPDEDSLASALIDLSGIGDDLYNGTSDTYEAIRTAEDDNVARVDNQWLAFAIVSGVGIVAFAVLMGVTALRISYQIAAPMADLIAAADGLAGGSFDPAPVEELAGRRDEVGFLARAFLKVAQDLAADEQALKDQGADLQTRLAHLKGG